MFLAEPESSDATERIYKSSADSLGFVMNLTRPGLGDQTSMRPLRPFGLS